MPKQGLIRAYDHQLQVVQRFADAAIIVMTLVYAVWVNEQQWTDKYTIVAISAVLLFYLGANISHLYQSRRIGGFQQELRPLATSWAFAIIGGFLLGYSLKVTHEYSRISLGLWMVLTPLLLLTWRGVVRTVLERLRINGRNTRSAAIIGSGTVARDLAQAIADRPWMGLHVVGFYDEYATAEEIEIHDHPKVPVQPRVDVLFEKARKNDIDIVYVALPLQETERIEHIMERLGDTTVTVYLVPDVQIAELMQGQWVTLGSVPTISVFDAPATGVDSWLKRCEDIVVSTVLIAFLAIPMSVIALAIKLTSPGPIIYRQTRYGLNCTPILVWKFRTMRVAETDEKFSQAMENDPRVTRVGRFLRRFSLDELPQLFNVLAGTMSMVGPRPHPVPMNEYYRARVRGYTQRHKVKPGITGLAQINGFRGPTDAPEKISKRIEYDVQYINNWSIWSDMAIIAITPIAILRGENAI